MQDAVYTTTLTVGDTAYRMQMFYDESSEDPRDTTEYLGHIVTWHNCHRYHQLTDKGQRQYYDLESLQEDIDASQTIQFLLSVYPDHDGLHVDITDEVEDANGTIYVWKDEIRKEWKVQRISPKLRATVEQNLRSEIDELQNWLIGEVYGYVIERFPAEELDETDEEDLTGGEHVDSCWGFYGYSYALEEAQRALREFSETKELAAS